MVWKAARGALPVAAVLGVVLAAGFAQAQEPATEAPAAETAPEATETPTIPGVPEEGTPQDYIEYVETILGLKPPADEQASAQFRRQQSRSLVAAADKILEQKTTPEQTDEAFQWKYRGLLLGAQGGDMQAIITLQGMGEQLVAKAEEVFENEPTEEQARTAVNWMMMALQMGGEEYLDKLIALPQRLKDAGMADLAGEVETAILMVRLQIASPDELEGIREEVFAFLDDLYAEMEGNEYSREQVGTAVSVLQRLERTGVEGVAAYYEKFAELFVSSEDGDVADLGQRLAGVARRLQLPGNKLELAGQTVSGEQFDWSAYRGKVVLVDFFATWCAPCREELPNVLRNYELFHEQGFDVVGISVDDNREDLEQYLKEYPVPWTIIHNQDPEATGPANPGDYYGIMAIPTVMLVDKDGTVLTFDARGPTLGRRLAELLGPPQGEASSAGRSPSQGVHVPLLTNPPQTE